MHNSSFLAAILSVFHIHEFILPHGLRRTIEINNNMSQSAKKYSTLPPRHVVLGNALVHNFCPIVGQGYKT
ncbi:hypothetical protein L1887_02828 [Cichorium endivia]|nr:hypothetical protein L1887_02828 [Cichorium endivia]